MSWIVGALVAGTVMVPTFRLPRRTQTWLYPAMLMVIAALYVVFAIIGGGPDFVLETAIASGFALTALSSVRFGPMMIVVGLAAHGTLDLVHPLFVANRGVPTWWPGFCLTYDLTAALLLYVVLRHHQAARLVPPSGIAKS